MKTHFDFGVPSIYFEVSVRELMAAHIRTVVAENQSDLQTMERAMLNLIEYHRPGLKGGAIGAIEFRFGKWMIWFFHPALPRHDTTESTVGERLQTCPVCQKALPWDSQMGMIDQQMVEVCSVDCLNALTAEHNRKVESEDSANPVEIYQGAGRW